MTFEDGALRLKLLGYEWCKFIRRDLGEIHFIKDEHAQEYFMLPEMTERKRYIASYIYDVKAKTWTKERSPLDCMPITDTERILYGKN